MIVKIKVYHLRAILARRCISQTAFAQEIGMAPNCFNDMLCWRRFPGPKARQKILSGLKNVGFDDIFELVEVPDEQG